MEEKMKVKKVRIKVMGMNKWFNQVGRILKNAEEGKYKRDIQTVSFANAALLRKTLSPKRLELLSIIKHQKPNSIYELAKMSERDRKSVIQDIKLLKQLGFVTLRKHHKERTLVTLEVPFEELTIQMRI